MGLSSFIICFGVLACYAALRTVKRGWIKAIVVLFMVVCGIQLGLNWIFPIQPQQVAQRAPDAVQRPTSRAEALALAPQQAATTTPLAAAPAMAQTVSARLAGSMREKLVAAQNDPCLLRQLKDTPLSPLVYVLEAHQFLDSIVQLKGQGANANDIAHVSQVFMQSFGDGAVTSNSAAPPGMSGVASAFGAGSSAEPCRSSQTEAASSAVPAAPVAPTDEDEQ